MERPKFHAGQRVVVARAGAFSGPAGSYKIVSALPLESGGRQYRVRKDGEAFDRILDEAKFAPFLQE